MQITFKFNNDNDLSISTVSLVGSFNNYDPNKGMMTREGEVWTFETELSEGEHFYNFLIDNKFLLNDPYANIYKADDANKIWSVVIINEDNVRIYNELKSTVYIDKYCMCDTVNGKHSNDIKRVFSYKKDKLIVARFEFKEILGFHSATVLWCEPTGKVYDACESLLCDEENTDNTVIWFSLDLSKMAYLYTEGLWTMKLFIDGKYILEDKFSILDIHYNQSIADYSV